MASITIACRRCGAQAVTTSAAEAMAWDEAHDAPCPALTANPEEATRG